MTAIPVELGTAREFWLAQVTDSTPQWSFREDSVGSVKRTTPLARTIRLGDPVNTGPNSNWQQLTWQGGELQDIWKDVEMFKSGDVNSLTETGKLRMWPGFQSMVQMNQNGNARGVVLCEGTIGSDAASSLYVGMNDYWPWNARATAFGFWVLNPVHYSPGDTRSAKLIKTFNEPIRSLCAAMADDYGNGVLMLATRLKLYTYIESKNQFFEDTGAPASVDNSTYMWNSMVGFNDALYYLHGHSLWKRKPKPPFGVTGTHTETKRLNFAHYLRGLCVWNNRMWFGVMLPNGKSCVYVSDGATSTKAFDFPHEFHVFDMVTVAGALYILGLESSAPGNHSNVVQQLWRYDGSSLKKLWQEGKFNDGNKHWPGSLTSWEGNVVWSEQGNSTTGNRARVMMYDPVNDAIVRGPGLDRHVSNTSGLNIYGVLGWNNTIVAAFQDGTNYSHGARQPVMVAYMREMGAVRNDFRFPKGNGASQFAANVDAGAVRDEILESSIYHGDDSVASELKTLISATVVYKCSGSHGKIDVYAIPDEGTPVLIATLIDNGSHGWQTKTFPVKPAGVNQQYLQATRWQYKFRFYNDDLLVYTTTDEPWVDNINTQWVVAPKKRRTWTIRVPINDAQPRFDGSSNPLSTADTLAQKLEDLHFTALPVKFWEPNAVGGAPGGAATCEVVITDFQRQQGRLDTNAGSEGAVSITLTENVIA